MSFSMAAATILATDPTPICTTTEPGLIGTITDWLIMLMETIGGIGVALAIALESIFPPIPSEVILPLSGFTAARGTLSLPGAIIWATIGSVLGAWTLYGISRWVGLHRINLAAEQNPRRQPQRSEQSQRLVHPIRHMVGAHRPRDSRGTLADFDSRRIQPHELPALHRLDPARLGRVEHHPRFPPVTCSATSGARFKARSACSRTWSSRP